MRTKVNLREIEEQLKQNQANKNVCQHIY